MNQSPSAPPTKKSPEKDGFEMKKAPCLMCRCQCLIWRWLTMRRRAMSSSMSGGIESYTSSTFLATDRRSPSELRIALTPAR